MCPTPRLSLLRLRLPLMVILALAVSTLVSPSAHAARPARVEVDGAQVLSGPSIGSPVVTTVRRGAAIAASNLPTEGFYKVRLGTGEVGWMSAESLVLFEAGSGEEGSAAPSEAPKPATSMTPRLVGRRRAVETPIMRFRSLGIVNLWNPAAITEAVGISSFNTGVGGAGEVHFVMTPRLSMMVRVEHQLKEVVGFDQTADPPQGYQFVLSSTPVMTGLEFDFTNSRPFSLHASIGLGLALNTRLKSTGKSVAAPNETIYTAHNFTGIVKGGVSWYVYKNLSLVFEAGYRHNRTAALQPVQAQNGSEIFEDGEGGFVSIPLNLSGPVLGVGVGIEF